MNERAVAAARHRIKAAATAYLKVAKSACTNNMNCLQGLRGALGCSHARCASVEDGHGRAGQGRAGQGRAGQGRAQDQLGHRRARQGYLAGYVEGQAAASLEGLWKSPGHTAQGWCALLAPETPTQETTLSMTTAGLCHSTDGCRAHARFCNSNTDCNQHAAQQ